MATVLEPSLNRGPVQESSDRSFGLVFAGVFSLIGFWPLLSWSEPRWWSVIVAAVLCVISFILPQSLRQFNRAWLALGRLLHRVVSPVIMGAIFFLCVTPIAVIMRLARKDVLSLALRSDLESYWIRRERTLPDVETMRRQF